VARFRVAAAAAGVMLTLALASCAATPLDSVGPKGGPPTAGPTDAPAGDDDGPVIEPGSASDPIAVGDEVPASRMDEVVDAGFCPASLSDGRIIVVGPSDPLPSIVANEIQARLDAIPVDPDDPFGTDTAAQRKIAENLAAESFILSSVHGCHEVVLVRPTSVGHPGPTSGSINSVRWTATSSDSSLQLPDATDGSRMGWGKTDPQLAPLLARVDAWLAGLPNPSAYHVFVHSH
jgi:hypothetical protein